MDSNKANIFTKVHVNSLFIEKYSIYMCHSVNKKIQNQFSQMLMPALIDSNSDIEYLIYIFINKEGFQQAEMQNRGVKASCQFKSTDFTHLQRC